MFWGKKTSVGFIDIDEKIAGFSWDEDELETSLKDLYQYCVHAVKDNVQWYWKRNSKIQVWAKLIRVISVLLLMIAGIIPVLNEMQWWSEWLRPGYATILIAVSGSLLLIDKQFGFSSSYVRFAKAAMLIETRLTLFHLTAADAMRRVHNSRSQRSAGNLPDSTDDETGVASDPIAEFFTECRTFVTEVNNTRAQETNAWAEEFQRVTREFWDMAQKQRTPQPVAGAGKVPGKP